MGEKRRRKEHIFLQFKWRDEAAECIHAGPLVVLALCLRIPGTESAHCN